jgi:hypothetical protein
VPGTSAPAIISLMVMHVVTTSICVGLLRWLTRAV